MPFIKVQNLKRDADGRICAGSAALVESIYVPASAMAGGIRASGSSKSWAGCCI